VCNLRRVADGDRKTGQLLKILDLKLAAELERPAPRLWPLGLSPLTGAANHARCVASDDLSSGDVVVRSRSQRSPARRKRMTTPQRLHLRRVLSEKDSTGMTRDGVWRLVLQSEAYGAEEIDDSVAWHTGGSSPALRWLTRHFGGGLRRTATRLSTIRSCRRIKEERERQ
jgi:hypothetical protein